MSARSSFIAGLKAGTRNASRGRFKRRRSFKRRPRTGMKFRRVGLGPITRIRRRSLVRRRRSLFSRSRTSGFPTKGIPSTLVMRDQSHTSRELMRMRTTYRYVHTPGSVAGIQSEVGTNSALYIRMTDIFSPGANGPWTGMTTVNGFTRQNLLYTNWQVRGCKLRCKVAADDITSSRVPIEVLVIPMSTAQYAVFSSGVGTYPFDQLKKYPLRSKLRTIHQSADYVPYEPGVATIHSFCSPVTVEARPGYYSQASTYGIGSGTLPTSLPVFVIAMSWEEALPASFKFAIEVDVDYSVLWWGRIGPALTEEEKQVHVGATVPEDMSEEEFDRLPEAMSALESVSESKEERKVDRGPGAGAPGHTHTPSHTPPPPRARDPSPTPHPLHRTISGPVKIPSKK